VHDLWPGKMIPAGLAGSATSLPLFNEASERASEGQHDRAGDDYVLTSDLAVAQATTYDMQQSEGYVNRSRACGFAMARDLWTHNPRDPSRMGPRMQTVAGDFAGHLPTPV
jgi:hypothetical protein